MLNYLILGHGGHGKNALADRLAEEGHGVAISSSAFACTQFIFKALHPKYLYPSHVACYNDRRNKRKEWCRLIRLYNAKDKTRLARELLVEHNIYVGMRAQDELIACLKEGLFSAIYWVDASPRVGLEGSESFDITFEWLKNTEHRKCPLVSVGNVLALEERAVFITLDQCEIPPIVGEGSNRPLLERNIFLDTEAPHELNPSELATFEA